MKQENTELVASKAKLAIAKGGLLIAPLVMMTMLVWFYTQKWVVIGESSSAMDWAVVGINTASIMLTLTIGYYIIHKVSKSLVEDLKQEGLLVEGVREVETESAHATTEAANVVIEMVDAMTDFHK